MQVLVIYAVRTRLIFICPTTDFSSKSSNCHACGGDKNGHLVDAPLTRTTNYIEESLFMLCFVFASSQFVQHIWAARKELKNPPSLLKNFYGSFCIECMFLLLLSIMSIPCPRNLVLGDDRPKTYLPLQ